MAREEAGNKKQKETGAIRFLPFLLCYCPSFPWWKGEKQPPAFRECILLQWSHNVMRGVHGPQMLLYVCASLLGDDQISYQDIIPSLCGVFPSDVAFSPIKKKKKKLIKKKIKKDTIIVTAHSNELLCSRFLQKSNIILGLCFN